MSTVKLINPEPSGSCDREDLIVAEHQQDPITLDFRAFQKVARLKREVIVTEKIDGTNAQILLAPLDTHDKYLLAVLDPEVIHIYPGWRYGDHGLAMKVGSRNRWLRLGDDNFGFAAWCFEHRDDLANLGVGRHFGEWFGCGIQRGYGLDQKRFALFNVTRWSVQNPNFPICCTVVPTLYRGEEPNYDEIMEGLKSAGSLAVPGYNQPEGIVAFHSASNQLYKRTFEKDDGKWHK